MDNRSVALAIVLILGSIVCLGCTDSGDESQESVGSEEIHTGAIQEEKAEGETLQANQSINLSSDVEWESNYRNGCFLLASDYESISKAANNGDYVSLEKAGSKLESDARIKLEESQKYQLPSSSTRQYGKSEYEAALTQFIEAGKYYSSASRKMQDGDTSGSAVDLQTALTCQELALEHTQNIMVYYQGHNSMGATQSDTNSGGVIASW
ncbi:MAG: hypothetical protein GX120_11450 [Methanosarcina mazei]|nr:hypothetical protein [Methanosarcina mazei]